MARKRHEKLYDDVLQAADAFSSQADRLSAAILEFEDLLNRLPSKAQIEVTGDDRDSPRLRYKRAPKGWHIEVLNKVRVTVRNGQQPSGGRSSNDVWIPLSHATLETKIKATALFETLLEELHATHQSMQAGLDDALSHVLPLLDEIGRHRPKDD